MQRWMLARERPAIWIVDLSKIKSAPATQRRMFAEHEARVSASARKVIRGSAFVAPSAWLRGLLTAVYWLKPPVYPHAIVSTVAEARKWLLEIPAEKSA
ncbi:MAG TPA: hypothetical protein VK524_21005 [Polyangiaceae bacterium]|nr:hypothetical protein [Polyangiaceae bacterium]